MTTTVNRPAVEVERASREKVAALMLRAVRDHGLTWPRHISHVEDRGEHGALLDIQVDGRAPWLGWVDFFGEPEFRSGLVVHTPWCGWTVLLSCREAPVLDAGTAALIDEATGPAADVRPPCRHCGGTVSHAPDCPTWTACTCGGEVVHQIGCPGCESDPSRAARHAANVRAGLVEALGAGPSVLSTYPHDAILAAVRDGVIVEQGRGDTGRMVYALAPAAGICMYCPSVVDLFGAGSIAEHANADTGRTPCAGTGEWPATDWDDEEIPKGTRAELIAFLAARWPEPSRVDLAAAVQIPVVVVELSRGGVMHRAASAKRGSVCGSFVPHLDSWADRNDLTTCLGCRARLDLPTRTPGAALVDEPATAHVAEHFRHHGGADQWADLTDEQRAALVAACQVAGWEGDWAAAYRHVIGGPSGAEIRAGITANGFEPLPTEWTPPAPAAWFDDARAVVAELDDIAVVSVAQLAEAVGVEPDVPIDLVPAYLDEPTQAMPCRTIPVGVEGIPLGDHLDRAPADSFGLDDAGRDGAEIAHLTGASS